MGLPQFHSNRTDTDVYVSRFVRSEDRWAPPVPIAESKGLERSPEIWIDNQSKAVHAAWVGNERRKAWSDLVVNSESATGDRRMEEPPGRPPRHFAVGTALARRPQLRGDGRGNLYSGQFQWLSRRAKERIHLFQSDDGGGSWQPLDVNFTERQEKGEHRITPAGRRIGRSGPAWSGSTRRRAGGRSSSVGRAGEFTWSRAGPCQR